MSKINSPGRVETRTFKLLLFVLLATLSMVFAAVAQTLDRSTLVVTVVDQNDAVVSGANIAVVNMATGATREAVSGDEGIANVAALPLTGDYKVSVTKAGFAANEVAGLRLRAGEIATVKVRLQVSGGNSEVTVFGTAEGVRADPVIGKRFDKSEIDETPILGRKITSVPLLNSAFRQGKGTGDLFVNQTYFITGVGSRRAVTFALDGASNDEGWGRQTALTTVPISAVQEVNILTNAFSAEYGWTSGPAFNIVTKSGTNQFHGEGLVLFRPGGWQAESFSTKRFCPESVPTCTTPSTLQSVSPVDIPDKLTQFSGAVGGPIVRDRTFFFIAADRTHQNRTTFLSPSLPAFLLPADGHLDYTGHYRQTLINGRLDHRLADNQNLMFRINYDQMFDDNPQDAVGGVNAPSVARRYSRRGLTTQVNHAWVLSSNLVNDFRFAYLRGDPVTKWEAETLSTIYTRPAGNGAVPFTSGQSRLSDLWGRQVQFADTLSLTAGEHNLRFGGSVGRHRSGGQGNEPGQLTLGTFTFSTTNATRNQLPLGQLTLADVQSYSQPVSFGIDRYAITQWLVTGFIQDDWKVRSNLTINLGLRYDRQTLTDAKSNFAPRVGFGWNPGGDARTAIRGGYGMYYTQVRTNFVAGYLLNGLDGIATYNANPGQIGFPTCLTGSCLPVNLDPRTIPASQIPARDITIRAGLRNFYRQQFARYNLNFDLLPNYSDKLVNPRSQVLTFGVEREVFKGFFAGADYVRQHVANLERTVDLNAPAAFDRTAVGQCRAANCNNAQSATLANATRPILPVAGGVRQVNTIMNLGEADYNGLQTQFSYRGHRRLFASLSYTLSKATNTTEPDGNGIGPSDANITRLGEEERGPSVVDQRHRAVIAVNYRFPFGFTAGTLMQFATARPFNATTGVDNNGDGVQNDRPVIDGRVISKSAFRGAGTQDVSIFVENRIRLNERAAVILRLEGFNVFNHANMLARGVTVFGNTATANPDFGRFVPVTTESVALPAFANIDPPRMFQLQARFVF
jgi:outer membrane receptor protein involved in Fe transport